VDINGNDGPSIKKTFSCENCKWLSETYTEKYICFHPDNLSIDKISIYDLFLGTIDKNLRTPTFCPYLIKKLRCEKLKELKIK